ncbi:MAG: TolC family protein [bacterium]|nr:TolC family protein [bacterium]
MKLKLLLLITLLPWLGYAQTGKVWTLEQCINHAYNNSIQVQRSYLSSQQNQASLNQSKAALAPSVNASANHIYNFGRNVNPVTNAISDFQSQTNTFGLNAGVTLFNGLANYKSIRQNSLLLDASLKNIEDAKNMVGLNVASAYLAVLLNKELLENAKYQLANSEEQLSRTSKLVQYGSLAVTEELQLQAQVASDETRVVTAENNLNLSRLQLMQLLQIPYDPEFDVVTPEIEVNENSQEELVLNPQKIYEEALASQPDVLAAEMNEEAQAIGVEVARGGFFPTISAFYSIDTRYFDQDPTFNFSEQLDNNLGQNVGFSMSVPIFNNLRVNQSIQNSKISYETAKLNTIETKNGLRQEIESAYLDARAAYNTYISSRNQVESLKISYENTEKMRAAGSANFTDYTLALNNLNAAESDLIRAKYDFIFKLKILEFYQGKTLSLD